MRARRTIWGSTQPNRVRCLESGVVKSPGVDSSFPTLLAGLLDGVGWSEWFALPLGDRKNLTGGLAGVYEIADHEGTSVYVGQTGGTFATRMGHLKEAVTGADIPFNDPHTAGPALWVLRTQNGRSFTARLFPAVVGSPERRALESVHLAIVRRRQGLPPLANYGGMPPGWTKSSSRRLGLRGSPIAIPDVPGEAPVRVSEQLGGDPDCRNVRRTGVVRPDCPQ